MAGSVVRSSTTSEISAAKPPASKRSAKVNGEGASAPLSPRSRAPRSPRATGGARLLDGLFEELARLAELTAVERRLRDFGFRAIAGTDEVGRGCLAGPVVAACVVLEHDPTLFGVDDSKQLSPADRLSTCQLIMRRARAVAVGIVEPQIIDRINILRASKLAMSHAVEHLSLRPDVLLLDAVTIESLDMPQIPLIGGDRRSITIAAASVVAKVYRDLLMESYHELYPMYDFRSNRGYATGGHLSALRVHGPSPIHRRSFEGVGEPMLLFGRDGEDDGPTR